MFNALDLIPAGTLEELIRDNATEISTFLAELATNGVQLDAGERPGFLLTVKLGENGTPATVIVIVQALDNEFTPLRDLGWYDLREVLKSVPIAMYLKKGKEGKKLAEKLQAAEAKRLAHFGRFGDDARHVILQREVNELRTKHDELAASFKLRPIAAQPQPQT